MNTPFKAANIILHVALISIFIVVLFFTYGLHLEEKILENQLNYVFSKFGRLARAIDPSFSLKDNKKLNEINIKDDPADIKKIDEYNKNLKMISVKALGAILAVAVVAVLFIKMKYNVIDNNGKSLDMKTYLLELGKMNLISLIFVGLTYVGFITFVGYNYLYINDSMITKKVLDKILV